MKFKEIVAPSMKELFVQTIENMILSGELKIGDKLPTERELADQMKISRSIVNLGLNELKQKGFVEINARKSTVVGDYIKNGSTDILLSVINYNGGTLDKKTFYSLMHFRVINEGEGAYLAALNRTDEDIKEIEEIQRKLQKETDVEEFSKLIFALHHAVFFATKNTIYSLVHNAFKNVAIKMTAILYRNYPFDNSLIIIDKLIEAIKQKDPTESRTQMINLVQDGIDNLAPLYYFDNHANNLPLN